MTVPQAQSITVLQSCVHGHDDEGIPTLSSVTVMVRGNSGSEMGPDSFVVWLPVNKAVINATRHCSGTLRSLFPSDEYEVEQGARGHSDGQRRCNMKQRHLRDSDIELPGEKL